jgi:hypothetical protein
MHRSHSSIYPDFECIRECIPDLQIRFDFDDFPSTWAYRIEREYFSLAQKTRFVMARISTPANTSSHQEGMAFLCRYVFRRGDNDNSVNLFIDCGGGRGCGDDHTSLTTNLALSIFSKSFCTSFYTAHTQLLILTTTADGVYDFAIERHSDFLVHELPSPNPSLLKIFNIATTTTPFPTTS